MIALLVAAALQATPPVPANCSLNDSPPTPCEVIFASDVPSNKIGVGFLTLAGDILVVGRPSGNSSFEIQALDFDGTQVQASGVCTVAPKVMQCRVITAAVNFNIKAVAQ